MGKKNTCAKRLAALATLRCADGLLLKAAPTAQLMSGTLLDVDLTQAQNVEEVRSAVAAAAGVSPERITLLQDDQTLEDGAKIEVGNGSTPEVYTVLIGRHPDFETWLEEVSMYPEAMEGVPGDLVKDPAFLLEAVQRNPTLLAYMTIEDMNPYLEEEALAAVRKNAFAFQYAAKLISPKSPKYKEAALAAVNKNGMTLQYVDHIQMASTADYKEVALAAVREAPMALQFVPEGSEDREEIERAARAANPELLENFSSFSRFPPRHWALFPAPPTAGQQ